MIKIAIVVIFILLLLIILSSCKTLIVSTYKGEKSEHFNGKKFHSGKGNEMGDFRELIKYQMTNRRAKWPTLKLSDITQQKVDKRVFSGIKYKLINHSTVLIQVGGINILTDPVYAKRASPFQWMGPARHRPPSIAYEDLPKIDVVVISHDHYDHLDMSTIKQLYTDHKPDFLVGLGLKSFFQKFGVKGVQELDWGGTFTKKELTFTFLTAKHWSNRGMSPFKTLWGSWMIESTDHTIYFAGDTGYGDHFNEIAKEYPNIDLALIPIGAYVPRSFMKYVHMPPEDAVKAHLDLNAKLSFGIHWGTFQLTGEGMYDPVDELDILLQDQGISNFHVDRQHDGYYTVE